MKILVAGAGGMMGEALYRHFTDQGHTLRLTDQIANEHWLSRLDVRNLHALRNVADNFGPAVIMNLAAMTDLEECESMAAAAISTNTEGSANCAQVAIERHIPYVYISTAGIFDGERSYYAEKDAPNPICVYGRTKYWGELIAQTVPKHLVMRCGWQMGSGPKDKKFINKLWKQIKAGATELNAVVDKYGAPTYSRDFVKQIEKLLAAEVYGTFNAVGKGSVSRYMVAVEFVRLLGLEKSITVNPRPSAFFEKEYYVNRPDSEVLINGKLNVLGLNIMQDWKDALAEYVEEYKEYFTL